MAQDTGGRAGRTPERPFLERKEKADGSVREYRCTLAWQARGLAVVRFPMERGGSVFGTPVSIPPGSVSFGFFWQGRPYNLYRMLDRNGQTLAHRFDAVANVRIGRDGVSYRDLVLDWWVLPDDTVLEEDRSEFDQMVADGTLSPEDREQANEAARAVLSRYRHIIERAAALLAEEGIGP